jgi:hypothetical protein
LDTASGGSECPLWVISGHLQCKTACPLYARKRTLGIARARQLWLGGGYFGKRVIGPNPNWPFFEDQSKERYAYRKALAATRCRRIFQCKVQATAAEFALYFRCKKETDSLGGLAAIRIGNCMFAGPISQRPTASIGTGKGILRCRVGLMPAYAQDCPNVCRSCFPPSHHGSLWAPVPE